MKEIKTCATCKWNNPDTKLPCGYCENYSEWKSLEEFKSKMKN